MAEVANEAVMLAIISAVGDAGASTELFPVSMALLKKLDTHPL